MPPRRSIPPPSPARSLRSNRGDDEWDNESMASTSLKVPNSRGKKATTSASIGLKDTSVNIAAAFHAAQTGHLPPPEQSFQSHTSASANKFSSNRSQRAGSQRAKSPAESLKSAARALSPVRFFLKSTEDENGDFDNSGAYNSFSSLGGPGNGSGESYSYAEEDDYVKRLQAQKAKAKPRISDGNSKKKRGNKSFAEDLPYRPAEDDEIYGSDSGGEGEGVVRTGALDGRAGTRGKREERGEGYLGMGLGIQPRQRKKGVKSYAEGSDEDDSQYQQNGEQEQGREEDHHSQRALSPFMQVPNGHTHRARSPTPVELLRAFSPRSQRKSPAPTFHPRRRVPGTIRTIITNILHGVVLGLQYIVESVVNLLHSILIRPAERMFGSSQGILRRLKQDWWKYLGAMLALNLALRALDAPWRSKGVYRAPDTPPSSIDEVAARITSLEQVTADISEMLRSISNGEAENKQFTHNMLGRVDDLENALMVESKRVETMRGKEDKGVKGLQSSFDALRAEVKGLVDRVGQSEHTVRSSQDKVNSLGGIDREVQDLKTRVGAVEKKVSDALDDGRLRAALEKILPDNLPIKINSRGTVDIDPRFWTEMKKVMISRTDTEAMVKRALSSSKGGVDMDEGRVRAWAEEVFNGKSTEYLSKDMFQEILHHELQSLRSEISSISSSSSSASKSKTSKPANVTIKSSKGEDLTSLFSELIDAALLRYSKDTIARTDYALFTAGARVIPQLTSDTLILSSASRFGKFVLGSKDVQGRPPATALHPDTSVGSCWPFKGPQGSLGVMLTRRIKVTDITLEHAPRELALDMTTAPKIVIVMGVVDNEDDKRKLQEWWSEKNESESPPDHLPLTTIQYDINSISNIQTFPISDEIQSLGIKIGIVIFKVEDNHGGDLTCLYRVRVHGEETNDDDMMA
ncbi:hypothetical protein I203_108263 [Kwoniella mangroviensis CBS 8507]|uniref:hypothetical protein n=1 Tax=Kwoniella mangroviensis CBS 8507 TaxID=1296122 RepID=UPI00080CDAE4|nr:uncharacterized protein I203_05154 [Kwoniella mangroviensis CBS 8507]OCF65479.1 hypothetical protein I203_05154 [Kwoniella mangroviensis CBS 8507]